MIRLKIQTNKDMCWIPSQNLKDGVRTHNNSHFESKSYTITHIVFIFWKVFAYK